MERCSSKAESAEWPICRWARFLSLDRVLSYVKQKLKIWSLCPTRLVVAPPHAGHEVLPVVCFPNAYELPRIARRSVKILGSCQLARASGKQDVPCVCRME